MTKKSYAYGLVIFCLWIFGSVSCADIEDYKDGNKLSDGIEISFENNTNVRADNYSTVKVIAKMTYPDGDGEEIPYSESIDLNTSSGVFKESGATTLQRAPDNQNQVVANLKVGETVETVLITASANGHFSSNTFDLLRAYPDSIKAQSSAGIVKVGASQYIDISAILGRTSGNTSIKTPVSFKASQSGSPVGYFTQLENAFKESSSDVVTVRFLSDNSADISIGTDIVFSVEASNDAGTTISDTLTFPTQGI